MKAGVFNNQAGTGSNQPPPFSLCYSLLLLCVCWLAFPTRGITGYLSSSETVFHSRLAVPCVLMHCAKRDRRMLGLCYCTVKTIDIVKTLSGSIILLGMETVYTEAKTCAPYLVIPTFSRNKSSLFCLLHSSTVRHVC